MKREPPFQAMPLGMDDRLTAMGCAAGGIRMLVEHARMGLDVTRAAHLLPMHAGGRGWRQLGAATDGKLTASAAMPHLHVIRLPTACQIHQGIDLRNKDGDPRKLEVCPRR